MQNLPSDPLGWEALADSGRLPVLLVRHGRTAWNLERRFVGRTDIPLDAEGLRQARALGQRLGDVPRADLRCSTLARARQTAEAIGAPTPLEGVHELDQGELEGLDGPTALARYPDFFEAWRRDPGAVRVPGGETLADCQARSIAALREAAGTLRPGPPMVVVTHQMVIATTVLHALGLPLRHVHKVSQANTAINLLSWGRDGLRLHRLNDHAHLPG